MHHTSLPKTIDKILAIATSAKTRVRSRELPRASELEAADFHPIGKATPFLSWIYHFLELSQKREYRIQATLDRSDLDAAHRNRLQERLENLIDLTNLLSALVHKALVDNFKLTSEQATHAQFSRNWQIWSTKLPATLKSPLAQESNELTTHRNDGAAENALDFTTQVTQKNSSVQ